MMRENACVKVNILHLERGGITGFSSAVQIQQLKKV